MEVDAFEFDSHLLNLFHASVNFVFSVDVVSKLAGEDSGEVVGGFFLDGYPPKDAHVGSDFHYFHQLVNGVSRCIFDSLVFGPFQITLVLYRVRVDDVLLAGSHTHHRLKFGPGSAIESSSSRVEVVEEGQGGVGLDGVVGFDPGESFLPGCELAGSLVFVVEKTAGLQLILLENVADLHGLRQSQESFIVAFQEVEGVGLLDSRGKTATSIEITTGEYLNQWEEL